MDLENRVVVVTGATGGLGRVVVRALGERGARLALVSSDQSRLDALVDGLGLPAEQVFSGATDLRNAEAAASTASAVMERFGRADVLLHLVGGWTGGKKLADTPSDDLAAMLDQHVWTTFHVLRAFVPYLVAGGWGRVIVVSSPVAIRPSAKSGAYAAAKAAEEALVLTVAQEAKDRGVTANVLQVRTIDVAHRRDREPSPANASWTTPEEITAAILYLCSDESAVINASRIRLDGAG